VLAAGASEGCEKLGVADVRGHEDDVVVYCIGPRR
jgi:hypothetical protein